MTDDLRRFGRWLAAGVALAVLVVVAGSGLSRGGAVLAETAPHCALPPSREAAQGYGTVDFANSCSATVQPALMLEVARLHSFEADTGRFQAIARRDPTCPIALWGAAMSARGNPLGGRLSENDRRRGRDLIDEADRMAGGSPRERALIGAIRIYYKYYPDQISRARAYADAMDQIRADYPYDPDIAALDGLAIIEGVDLADKTYARQKRAGAILERVMAAYPNHPGAPHYLIHAYDYTALAPLAVHAAEVYPTIATASPHAQHMPSHIWSMLGAWDRSITANRRSGALIDPAAAKDPVAGDVVFDHAFDFIAYARLQRGEDHHVAADLAARGGGPAVVAARYVLERGDWAGAAALRVPDGDPFDRALALFTRAYGAARSGRVEAAALALKQLEAVRPQVAAYEGDYWGVFVDIYADAARAWLYAAQGQSDAALALMRRAAAADDGHEKHIYLENKIVPIRESLADMEEALGHTAEARADYEVSLRHAPNRYRSFLGMMRANEATGDSAAARVWSTKLIELTQPGDRTRPGIAEAKALLAEKG